MAGRGGATGAEEWRADAAQYQASCGCCASCTSKRFVCKRTSLHIFVYMHRPAQLAGLILPAHTFLQDRLLRQLLELLKTHLQVSALVCLLLGSVH